jgi:hypothetical protein
MTIERFSPELRALIHELEEMYWIPFMPNPLDALNRFGTLSEKECPVLHEAFTVFTSNLKAAKELIDFPWFLVMPLLPGTSKAVNQADLGDGGDMTDEQAKNMELVLLENLSGTREHFIKNKMHLQRVMHQALILLWGSLETYCKQVFIASLNQVPSLMTQICKTPALKERFGMSNQKWGNLLETHDFDLKGKLGTIIAANQDFSSPQLILELFPSMFAEISKSDIRLEQDELGMLAKLGQRRHLIAHRCAVVDYEYMSKTKDETQQLGSILHLKGWDCTHSMSAVARFGCHIYAHARHGWVS